MVSRKQHTLTFARSLCLISIVLLAAPAQLASAAGSGPKYYSDDPLWREPAPHSVRDVTVRTIDDVYDFLDNSFVTPGREGEQARKTPRRALDINTLGEVPDSPWYTNRHAFRRMSM